MATLYLTEPYSTVKIEGEALRVHYPAEHGTRTAGRVVRVPLVQVEQVMVLGEITLTTPAIHALLQRRIPVHYLSARGRSYGALTADWGKNSGVRLAQYGVYGDIERRFAVARACVAGKLLNMRTTLLRYARSRERDEALTAAAQTIRSGRCWAWRAVEARPTTACWAGSSRAAGSFRGASNARRPTR
jgi:CRISP-associated protein Cas1